MNADLRQSVLKDYLYSTHCQMVGCKDEVIQCTVNAIDWYLTLNLVEAKDLPAVAYAFYKIALKRVSKYRDFPRSTVLMS